MTVSNGGYRATTVLTHGTPQEDEEQSDGVENVIGGNPQDELQVEGVELGDEEENDDADDGDPPLKTGQWVPGEFNPAMRRKLTKESLDFPSECRDLVETSPVVGLHAEIPAKYTTGVESLNTRIAGPDLSV